MTTIPSMLEERNKEAGGSLIELIIATSIALVLVSAVMHISVHSSKVRKADAEIHLAWSACRNVIEEVRTLPVSQILALNGTGFDVPGPNGETKGLNVVKSNTSGLTGVITAIVEVTAPLCTMYRVTATVNWTGVSGEQDFSLQTLVVKR